MMQCHESFINTLHLCTTQVHTCTFKPMLCTVVGYDREYLVNENGLVSPTGNYKNTTIDLFWPSMKYMYSVCTCVIKSVELREQSCEGYRHLKCLDASSKMLVGTKACMVKECFMSCNLFYVL